MNEYTFVTSNGGNIQSEPIRTKHHRIRSKCQIEIIFNEFLNCMFTCVLAEHNMQELFSNLNSRGFNQSRFSFFFLPKCSSCLISIYWSLQHHLFHYFLLSIAINVVTLPKLSCLFFIITFMSIFFISSFSLIVRHRQHLL